MEVRIQTGYIYILYTVRGAVLDMPANELYFAVAVKAVQLYWLNVCGTNNETNGFIAFFAPLFIMNWHD